MMKTTNYYLILILYFLSINVISAQTLKLDKNVYHPGELINVHFTASDTLSNIAWIGILPSTTPHGSEDLNDKYDVAQKYVMGDTNNSMLFRVPEKSGSWDIRLNSTDDDGIELASITFHVDTTIHIDYNTTIEEELAIWAVPAVGIGIIKNGELQQIITYGELKKNIPISYDAIFNVASLTKPVVTMLTLILVSNGEWDLDEPLANYWIDPDINDNPYCKILTTRHVLTHQTGFDNWRRNNKLDFNFKPGTDTKYSGEGFEYLRKALENKFNKTMEELSDSLLFTRYKMTNTSYVWNEKIDASKFAVEHDKGGDIYQNWKRNKANAADDLLTTIKDYGLFGVNTIKETGLTEEVFKDMIKPQSRIDENESFGLGWDILHGLPNDEYALVHTGSDRGVQTLIALLPNSQRGLVIFTNGDYGFKIIEKVIIEHFDIGKEIIEMIK